MRKIKPLANMMAAAASLGLLFATSSAYANKQDAYFQFSYPAGWKVSAVKVKQHTNCYGVVNVRKKGGAWQLSMCNGTKGSSETPQWTTQFELSGSGKKCTVKVTAQCKLHRGLFATSFKDCKVKTVDAHNGCSSRQFSHSGSKNIAKTTFKP